MPREIFNHKNASSSVPLSPAVRAGDTVYISGQVPTDSGGNIVGSNVSEQAHQVFKNCQAALALADASFDDVVKVNVYLTDVNNFAAMNEVYRSYFPDSPPARTTVGTPLARLGLLIEIDMVAYAPK
ncbi:MAG: RidA family protein [Trueperaceae bacterium]|nr:RidA family protein [Trueperaceae bacterium]